MTVASPIEAEADKAEERMNAAVDNLKKHGLEVIPGKKVISTQTDALELATAFARENIDALVILAANWSGDALVLSAINELNVPVLLWAIPSPATYSLALVQHVASLLKEVGVPYKYVYGEPSGEDSGRQIAAFARVAAMASMLRKTRIGLIGPRPTWRITGPTDTSYDEIDLRRALGIEIVHIGMAEFLSAISAVSSEEANQTIRKMRDAGKVGEVEVEEATFLKAAKAYVAISNLVKKLDLAAVAVECYPDYLGLVCLAASWLAEEGVVVGCEGDIGTAVVAIILRELTGGASGIMEPFAIYENNAILLGHPCGSGAISLAESRSKVHLRPFRPGEGVFVHFPVKSGRVTIANLSGRKGTYKMFIATGESAELASDDWSKIGGLVARIQFREDVKQMFDRVIGQEGIDHHWPIVFGDVKEELSDLCNLLGIRVVY